MRLGAGPSKFTGVEKRLLQGPRKAAADLMAIQKQESYEGAALHLIARTGQITSIRYDPPFFLLNDRISVLLKCSTRGRSP